MPQPSLSAYHPSLGERLQQGISGLLGKVVNQRYANHLGERLFSAINDLTPVGNATMAADAGTAIRNGHPFKGLGLGALAILPGAAGKAAKGGMFGARKVYHASPEAGLERILAQPPSRQYDNATSQFGAFFAPTAEGASRYGPNMYQADLALKNPYTMDWSEFAKFQAIEKAADGSRIPGEMWAKRADELREEAIRFRNALAGKGHDGIIVRGPRGDIKEIASFNDVPLK